MIRVSAVGPTWLAAQVMLMVWRAQRLDKETIARKEAEVYRRAQAHIYPIGIMGCLAIALLSLLFLL